jgi:hypothetical protein
MRNENVKTRRRKREIEREAGDKTSILRPEDSPP